MKHLRNLLTVIGLMLPVLVIALPQHEESAAESMPAPESMGQGSLLFATEQGGWQEAPRLDTVVNIKVSGLIARARVEQHFRNPSQHWQEGIYVFPLPENAAVDRLKMKIGERVIEGQIREREEARKIYQKARAEGRKTSLVSQQRPNIFTSRVANIAPGETIVVSIEYQHQVDYRQGEFSLRFPMVVGPRYIPGSPRAAPVSETGMVEQFAAHGWAHATDQVPDAAAITPPVDVTATLRNPVSISVSIDAGLPLAAIDSAYHAIATEALTAERYRIRLAQADVPADRDFELRWTAQPDAAPRAAVFTEQWQDNDYLMLMLVPPVATAIEDLPREVIFVIDTSGSMGGESIRQARQALLLGLDTLEAKDRFNVIQFNSGTWRLFSKARSASHANLEQARQYVRSLQATGGTEMAGALHSALEHQNRDGLLRQVVFITDGAIGNETALFDIIRERLDNSRLFTVGIGSAPNAWFMKRAAEFGRGTYTLIGQVDEVASRMQTLLSQLESPLLTDLAIAWPATAEPEIWPQRLPDLYAGEPLMISARKDSMPAVMTVTGRLGGQPWSARMVLNQGEPAAGVATLWARRRIEGLMNDPGRRGGQADAIRAEIVDTALRHHLVSKYTSLVAVDVTPARPAQAELKSAALKTQLPAGWDAGKVFGHLPQTATPASIHVLIGLTLGLLGWLGIRLQPRGADKS